MRKDRGGPVKAGDILKNTLPVPAESKQTHPPPTTTDSENPQLSLFQNFLYDTPDEKDRLCNAVDLWDSVPRYSVNRKAANRARELGELPEAHITTFHNRGRVYSANLDRRGFTRNQL